MEVPQRDVRFTPESRHRAIWHANRDSLIGIIDRLIEDFHDE